MGFRIKYLLTWLVLSLLLLSVPTNLWAQPKESQSRQNESQSSNQPKFVKHIYLLVIPGLTDQVLKSQYLPNIRGLGGEGVTAKGVIGVFPSENKKELAVVLRGSELKDNEGAISTKKIAQLFGSSEKDVNILDGSKIKDGHLINAAIDKFKNNKPYLNIIIFPEPQRGQNSLHKIDKEVGKLINTLREYGVYDYSLITVTGVRINHKAVTGNFGEAKKLMALVMRGPSLKVGYKLPIVQQADIMPTIFYASQFKELPGARGNVIWNALKAGNALAENDLLLKRIADLSSGQHKLSMDKLDLLIERENYKHEKSRIDLEQRKAQNVIQQKERLIEHQKQRIRLYERAALIIFVIAGFGYMAEYYYLRKRFLMF